MAENSVRPDPLGDVEKLRACEQCGTCSSACPLTGVDGFNIRRILRHVELGQIAEIADSPYPWQCTVCGRCETACPNGVAILDIIRRLRELGPEERVPVGPPPCAGACPGGIDIPGYLRAIAAGDPDRARDIILEAVPLPGVLGRVCTHPCETACRRGEVNQPVAICALKRYATDHAAQREPTAAAPATGRKVAVVGAGPAGLTAAFYLRRKGHAVTILEGAEQPGGMMRYGIPRYRLPEDVLDTEIGRILDHGIELKTGVKLGRDFDVERLKGDGFDAVFLALGLQRSRTLDLEGSGLAGVDWGLDFLGRVGAGEEVKVGERVLVIGGGDVAVDAALSALRLGARAVTMACLEQRAEMPAHAWEIAQALEEGVSLLPGFGPARVLGAEGRVSGVELVECASVFDENGKFDPIFGSETREVPADQVILAIGQTSDVSFAGDGAPLAIEGGLIVVDPKTGATGTPGLFAGGEIATGPGALIDAIAEGKKVAAAIDRFLGGDGVFVSELDAPAPAGYDGRREKGFADRSRVAVPTLPVAERQDGFVEVEGCLADADAVAEARRCFQCDLERHPERLTRRETDSPG